MKRQQIQLNKSKQTYEQAVRMIRQSIDSYGNGNNRYGAAGGPLVTQEQIESFQNQNLMVTDRDPVMSDFDGQRNSAGLNIAAMNSSQAPVPCNTKQYNTVNQSMDCNSSQTGFYKGATAHQPGMTSKQQQSVRQSHKPQTETTKSHWRPQQPKKSISNEMGGEDGAAVDGQKVKNLKGGRGVNSMNLHNNSMNSSSL